MKPGPKPRGKIPLEWSPTLAYTVGLLVADGCLSKDGRHVSLTSKDRVQVETFRRCLKLKTKLSTKLSGSGNLAYHTQFGDVLFYRFLMSIGITPAKSNTILSVSIPDKYFMDYLRGYFDGDGSSYSYFDPLFKKSYRFYISFTSGSTEYLEWLKSKLSKVLGVTGYLCFNKNTAYAQLKYAKSDAVVISRKMYYSKGLPHLRRKYLKIRKSLRIIESCRSGGIGRRAAFRSQ